MGGLKIGDKIIITDFLSFIYPCLDYEGKIAEIIEINENSMFGFPFKVSINNIHFWVDGIPYSSLMMELL